jgi:hypothetical protein
MNNIQIKQFIDERTGLDISNTSRFDVYIKARCIFYYLCFKYSSDIVTFDNVAKTLGRNHATVMHGIKAFNDIYQTDRAFKKLVDEIECDIKKEIPVKFIRDFKTVDTLKDFVLKRRVKNLKMQNMLLKKEIRNILKEEK